MKHENIKGFTIFELSIVIIVFGMLFLIVAGFFSSFYKSEREFKTEESLEMIESSLFEFQARMGRYPCPANPTLSPGDPQYAIEQCVGGVVTTGRDANGDLAPDNILIGSVPYRSMLDPDGDATTEDGVTSVPLTEVLTKDGWDNKLTYVVSEKLTDLLTFSEDYGAISVVDENDQSVITPADSAHMVLISHGKNGVGAYSAEGGIVSDCGVAPPFPPALLKDERENCNNDAVFISAIHNDNPSHTYDDKVKFLDVRTSIFWVYTGPNQVVNYNPGFVGVGVEDPEERFHIDGDLASTSIYVNNLCDGAGEDCMPVEAIGGDLPQMTCSGNQVAVGIEENSVVCGNVAVSSTLNSCPVGEVIVAVSNQGNVKCAVP